MKSAEDVRRMQDMDKTGRLEGNMEKDINREEAGKAATGAETELAADELEAAAGGGNSILRIDGTGAVDDLRFKR